LSLTIKEHASENGHAHSLPYIYRVFVNFYDVIIYEMYLMFSKLSRGTVNRTQDSKTASVYPINQ